jgi:hypothetical protein
MSRPTFARRSGAVRASNAAPFIPAAVAHCAATALTNGQALKASAWRAGTAQRGAAPSVSSRIFSASGCRGCSARLRPPFARQRRTGASRRLRTRCARMMSACQPLSGGCGGACEPWQLRGYGAANKTWGLTRPELAMRLILQRGRPSNAKPTTRTRQYKRSAAPSADHRRLAERPGYPRQQRQSIFALDKTLQALLISTWSQRTRRADAGWRSTFHRIIR